MNKRKQHSPNLKFQIALKAIETGNCTAVARQYGVSNTLANRWKHQLMEHGVEVFHTTQNKELEKLQQHVSRLEQLIGKKEVEINLLKNFLDVTIHPNGR